MSNRRSNTFKSVLIAAALFVAVFAASATPADAKAHGKTVVRVHPHGVVAPRVAVRAPFVAPRHVAFRTVRTFDPFFSGRVFYAPHNHFHVVYRFPVYTAYGVVYQPYSYCGDDLYNGYGYDGYGSSSYGYAPSGHVSVVGPRFGVSVGF